MPQHPRCPSINGASSNGGEFRFVSERDAYKASELHVFLQGATCRTHAFALSIRAYPLSRLTLHLSVANRYHDGLVSLP